MKLAICIITYNRPDSLNRVLSSIHQADYAEDEVDLFISIDYSGSDSVEKAADKYEWAHGKKHVIAHRENLGLRKHILSCGEFVYDYDGLIVLEDDVYVAPSFYIYAKLCVDKYHDDESVAGISLYSFHLNYHNKLPFEPLVSNSDVYLMQNAQSWGQVWMPKQWKAFKNWYKDNSGDFEEMPHLPKSICSWKRSWLKYHTRYCIEQNKFFIYPYIAQSTCFSDVGDHTSANSSFIQVQLASREKKSFILNPSVIYDAFFENCRLAETLGIPSEDLCVDIYGDKNNRTNCRYWLTREIHDYKILKSFGLQMRPMEMNVIRSIAGNEIFLYDTHHTEPFSNYGDTRYRQLNYLEYLYDSNFGLSKALIIFKESIQRYLRNRLFK